MDQCPNCYSDDYKFNPLTRKYVCQRCAATFGGGVGTENIKNVREMVTEAPDGWSEIKELEKVR